MSLEAKIEALTSAVVALTEAQNDHTEKLNAVLAAGGKSASAGEGEEKPKRTRAKKEDTKTETGADTGEGEGDGEEDTAPKLTTETVKMKIVAPWLGEFANVEGDPETAARKSKIKGALAKLVGKEGATVADVPAKDLQRVVDWVAKQKETDTGFGKGRLTAVPGSDDGGSDDEEI